MNRFLVALLILFLSTNLLHSQHSTDVHKELGIDVSSLFIYLLGGTRGFGDMEFIYRIAEVKKDIRFKLDINNRSYCYRDLIAAESINFDSSINFRRFEADYTTTINVLGSIGLAKHLKVNNLLFYTGLDLNFGVERGEIESKIIEVEQGLERIEMLSANQKTNLLIMGLTPVLGFKKQLTDKFGVGIEFGANLNSSQGNLTYVDQNGVTKTESEFCFNIGHFQIINDLTLFLKI